MASQEAEEYCTRSGAKCATCPFAKDGRPNQPVLAVGPRVGAMGILIGESPGADEQREGVPFVGPTGQELDNELTKVGLPRERLLIVNAIACCPPLSAKSEGNMRKAVDCCRPLLLAQIQNAQAPYLVMGKWAYYALTTKDKGVMSNRGFIQSWP